MTSADASPRVDWTARANGAARSVTALFGRKLFFLPGTHLGAVTWPVPGWRDGLKGKVFRPWHYWWQAHYADCLVDAGRREQRNGATQAAGFNGAGRPSAGRLASRLVTGIWLRNAFKFVNNYYDDMAWLALAVLRLDQLAEEAGMPGRRRKAGVRKALTLQFDAACTKDLGGGAFWSKKRDFKNTPATAPIALYYARTGHRAKAQSLLDWLDATLFDPDQGLYLDGARLDPEGNVVIDRAVYTYNQGPVLGAQLELGGDANLSRAAEVVEGVARLLTVPVQDAPAAPGTTGARRMALRCEGTGDGGLFTGILCRYLARAAVDARLPERTRATAARLVLDTAGAFWEGKRLAAPSGGAGSTGRPARYIFSMHAAAPADATYPPGAVVELSTQLQAWMTFEAAASITLAD
ncbi:glycoside hydrolase family 76 protein [Arthrobacter sp. D3-16]